MGAWTPHGHICRTQFSYPLGNTAQLSLPKQRCQELWWSTEVVQAHPCNPHCQHRLSFLLQWVTSWCLKQVQDLQMERGSCHPGEQSSWLKINKYPYPWLSASCSFLHSTSSCKKTTDQTCSQCAFQTVNELCETAGKDVMKNPGPHAAIPETWHSGKGV